MTPNEINELAEKIATRIKEILIDEFQVTPKKEDGYLSISDVAQLLGKGYNRTRELIKAGKIRSAKIPGTKRLYVRRSWLDEAFSDDGARATPIKRKKPKVW